MSRRGVLWSELENRWTTRTWSTLDCVWWPGVDQSGLSATVLNGMGLWPCSAGTKLRSLLR